MAKEKITYRCSECGWTSPKWVGQCRECGAWGTVDQAGIQRLVDEHQQGLQDRGELLWMVMVLETWMRTLPDQTSPSPMH